jgi:aspartate/glutamate racemase
MMQICDEAATNLGRNIHLVKIALLATAIVIKRNFHHQRMEEKYRNALAIQMHIIRLPKKVNSSTPVSAIPR